MPFGKKCVLIFFFLTVSSSRNKGKFYTWMVIQRMVMKDILYSVEESKFQGMMVDYLGGGYGEERSCLHVRLVEGEDERGS